MKNIDYSYIMSVLSEPLEIAKREGLELEFVASICVNLMNGQKDIQEAANDALCEWDM